ncbi:MAG: RES family NAD+ phosphorylase [Verrucomicrobiota bacterium]
MTSWHDRAYRCVSLRWARPQHLISGEGSRRFGSRWMRQAHTAASYAATTDFLALKEAKQTYGRFGIKKPISSPRVLVELTLKLDRCLDLQPLDGSGRLPSIDEMMSEDWEATNKMGSEALSQAIGRACFDLKFEGLIIPSARDNRGRNIVWFPENLKRPDAVVISGEDELKDWLNG